MSKSRLRGIGLQFFADESDTGGNGGDTNEESNNNTQGNDGSNDQSQNNNPPPKTFTQEDVNRMLANEKRQGRQAALKALGLDPNDKNAEKKAKEILDAQKSDAEKAAEALKAAQDAQSEATKKAEAAERKLAVMVSGCKPDFVDEVTALVSAKMNDDTNFEAALKAVKEKCAAFFAEDEDSGTGGGQSHRRQNPDKKPGSFGTRLAQGVVSSNTKENPYFKI